MILGFLVIVSSHCIVGRSFVPAAGGMSTLTENDIREGLSYAYFHAIATMAGFSCHTTPRTVDAKAIDAIVFCDEKLAQDSKNRRIFAPFQLKATSTNPILNDGKYSFRIEQAQYNKLRSTESWQAVPLVLMILPTDKAQWIGHDEEALISRKCSYWVSLRNAPTDNADKPTIHVPKKNILTPDSLRALMTRFSRLEEVNYGE